MPSGKNGSWDPPDARKTGNGTYTFKGPGGVEYKVPYKDGYPDFSNYNSTGRYHIDNPTGNAKADSEALLEQHGIEASSKTPLHDFEDGTVGHIDDTQHQAASHTGFRSAQNTDLYEEKKMDLSTINPLVYEAWKEIKLRGEPYYIPTHQENIDRIETLVKSRIPSELKSFLLEYSCITRTKLHDCSSFKTKYVFGDKLETESYHITSGKHIIQAIQIYNLYGKLPMYILPLRAMNYSSLLVDLRPESYGKIYFHPEIRDKFGKGKNTWKNIGFVADTLVEMIAGLNTEEEIKRRYNL